MSLMVGNNRSADQRMARRPRGPEKINMEARRFGYFPQQFTWRGRCYDVHAVERCWTVSRKRLGNKVDRLCFRVRGSAVDDIDGGSRGKVSKGTFNLFQDLNTNTWYLEKAVSQL